MNLVAETGLRIAAALQELKSEGRLPADLAVTGFDVTPPRDASHGDMACNAAMVLAKSARMKPRDIAEALAAKLKESADFEKVDVAGPGFLNITFKPAVWQAIIARIRQAGAEYGRASLGRGERVNIEYVSANPTGPMHVGHCRGAVFGDALANLVAFAGYDVTREYYINDAGGQVDVLARSAFVRYREALGETGHALPEGGYPGDYLLPVGAALAKTYGKSLVGKPEAEWLPIVRRDTMAAMLAMIKEDLAALSVKHDVFFSCHSDKKRRGG